jgi:hypothetical protein
MQRNRSATSATKGGPVHIGGAFLAQIIVMTGSGTVSFG